MLLVESSLIDLVPDIKLLEMIEEKIKTIYLQKAEDSFDIEFRKKTEQYIATALVDFFILYKKLAESLVRLNQPRNSPEREIADAVTKIVRYTPGIILILGGTALSFVSKAATSNLCTIFSNAATAMVCGGIFLCFVNIFKK